MGILDDIQYLGVLVTSIAAGKVRFSEERFVEREVAICDVICGSEALVKTYPLYSYSNTKWVSVEKVFFNLGWNTVCHPCIWFSCHPSFYRDSYQRFSRFSSTLVGILFATLVSGFHVIHLFIEILINAFIIKFASHRVCHMYSLVLSFMYLLMYRFSDELGLPIPPAHTSAIIMILTLKLIGLAFEVHDSHVKAESLTEKKALNPGFLEIFHYGLNHAGLITGPYLKFSVWKGIYRDCWNPAVTGENEAAINTALYKRARNIPFYIGAFLISGYFFPLNIVETEVWIQESSFLWKLFYMMPIFFNFRMRIYAGFCLSECACISAGVGAYPVNSNPRPGQGPRNEEALEIFDKKTEINFETVHNIDEWAADFVPTMREALKSWNMTVQHWLVSTVYKRFPYKPLRTTAVMLVSSIWHGVYSGYYLSLGSVPLFLMVEDVWVGKVRPRLSIRMQNRFDWCSWFLRMRWFDYLGMGFLLLRVKSTMNYWSGVYYIGHMSLPFLYILGHIVIFIMKKMDGREQLPLPEENKNK
ncbi:lysophospholipid acyltransferase 7 [Eurytemora carolleeae]|uniref:lysophospholipid acyltransferase 7 n=1 Tax=Eurytemora carolleeae TaxID=1294199 RepID=UPI000C7759A0|nr:lysophospholipid acyltransferase 7 [Eurytemora carolleeae]|eukprot:XP_023346078.1 lysophospholipid acyltransferase 7-like [Eurytemora affinis]